MSSVCVIVRFMLYCLLNCSRRVGVVVYFSFFWCCLLWFVWLGLLLRCWLVFCFFWCVLFVIVVSWN